MPLKTRKHKIAASVGAVTMAAAILLTGTFAWQSISQEALNEKLETVNPGGRLHDDFNGTNKDVYVENFGDTPIFARVRLDEYMEIGAGAGLKTGDDGADSKTATSLVGGADINDKSTWKTHIPGASSTDDPFHQYIEWEMGGQTVYMPTFNMNKDSLKADINGTYEGTTPDDNIHYDDYHAYSMGEQKTDDEIYDADDDTEDEQSPIEGTDITTVADQQHTAKETLTATVMTMQEWLDAGAKPGPYWVYDVDGWAYWAQAIEPDTATGLLLDGLTQLSVPDDDWYYGINVVGQFASLGDWGTAEGNDGFFGDDAGAKPTDNAVFLLNQAAGYKLKVTVSAAGDATTVKLGETLQMSAEVTMGGKKHANQDVTWSVSIPFDSGATINTDGLLTVGANMAVGGTLTVKAISAADNTVFGTYEVTLESPWDTSGVGNITPGSLETATIDGIDWYVLARDGNKVLIFQKDIFEAETKPFSEQDTPYTWKESSLRTYLNGEWLTSKPTLSAHAVETTLTTRPAYDSNSETFDETTDKVFCLSEADIFGTHNHGEAVDKDYTLGEAGIIVSDSIRTAITTEGKAFGYWLRSPASTSDRAEYLNYLGQLYDAVYWSNTAGVRPAMWINLAQ